MQWSVVSEITETSLRETEYRAGIIADRLSANIEKIDTLLRIGAGIVSDSLPGMSVTNSGFERRIKDELLLMPEVDYIVLLSPERNILWKSAGFPVNEKISAYSSILLNRPGAKFLIDTHKRENEESYHIHISRAVRDSRGDLVAIVEAVAKIESILPSPEEPLLRGMVRTMILSIEKGHLYQRYVQGYEYAAEDWIQNFILNPSDQTHIVGGIKVALTGKYSVAVNKTRGFPFIVFVASDMTREMDRWILRTLQTVILIFVLGILAAYISYHSQVKRSTAQVAQHSAELEEVNQKLLKINSERELLLKEVHHRVKNSLSLISSMISLVVSGKDPITEQTLKDLQARILAIQDVHNALYKSKDFTTVPSEEYLKGLAETIIESFCAFPVNIDYALDHFMLPAREAISLGLVTSEIITNAIKYGLEPGGTLRVESSLEKGSCRVLIANDGRPYINTKSGLGTLLIKSLVEQLKGHMELLTENETCYVLTFPLDGIAEAT